MSVPERTKICNECKIAKSVFDFWQSKKAPDGLQTKCKDCIRKKSSYAAISKWLANIWKRYDMLPETYYAKLNEQNGVCAICKQTSERMLSVDHCDDTKINRGLLCNNCNPALGGFHHDPKLLRAAADYIEHWHPEKVTNG